MYLPYLSGSFCVTYSQRYSELYMFTNDEVKICSIVCAMY